MTDNSDLYQRFYKSYKNAFPSVNVQVLQKRANAEWNDAKSRFQDKNAFVNHIQQQINAYNLKTAKKKVTLMSYFATSNKVSMTIVRF